MAIISKYNNQSTNDDLVNEKIRFKEVLVIDQNGDQLGVMSRNAAINTAYDANLDLVCVAPKAKTPVCRIMDYGKYRFEQQKKQKEIQKSREALKTGDKVITAGGIYGKIKEIGDTYMLIEVADGVRIRVDKTSIFASAEDAQQQK